MKTVFKHYRCPKSLDALKAGFDLPPVCAAEISRLAGNLVGHYRRGETEWEPTERGGATFCYIFDDDKCVGEGMAICSRKDAFNYKRGRDIAYGRALRMI